MTTSKQRAVYVLRFVGGMVLVVIGIMFFLTIFLWPLGVVCFAAAGKLASKRWMDKIEREIEEENQQLLADSVTMPDDEDGMPWSV